MKMILAVVVTCDAGWTDALQGQGNTTPLLLE